MIRKDNMNKHCREIHGTQVYYLRNGKKPIRPYCNDWRERMLNPPKLSVPIRDDESSISSNRVISQENSEREEFEENEGGEDE